MSSHIILRSLIVSASFLSPMVCAGQGNRPHAHTAAEVAQGAVIIIGELGLPLGTVAEIEATIVDGSTVKERPDLRFEFLLSVDKVNGKPLAQARVLQFVAPFRWVNLVSDESELPKINNRVGDPPQSSDAEIRRMKRNYIGARYKLAAYEEGMFSGKPYVLPDDCRPWSDRMFAFHTRLVVLAIR